MRDDLPNEARMREQGVYRAGDEPDRFRSTEALNKKEMNKIKVFVGPRGSGKTQKASELAKGKKFIWLDGFGTNHLISPFFFAGVNFETEAIIIDNIVSESMLRKFIPLFYNSTLTVYERGKNPVQIKRPDIILICDFKTFEPKDSMIYNKTEIVDFGKKEVANG